jgi:hypothetical protein
MRENNTLAFPGTGAYSLRPTELTATVQRLLEQCPGEALCDACLAFACSVSLTEMRVVTTTLTNATQFVRGMATCASCRRQTTTLARGTRPTDEKCVHCSKRIEPSDDIEVVDTERFHRHCWARLTSEESVRASKMLSRRSQDLIRRSHDLMGLPPLEDAAGSV